ncbi:MAG: GNAT family N-acetyltransferase [Marinoscillum sp.]
MENSLKNLGVNEIYITQPQSVYRSIPKGWMKDIGFNVEQTEIGHYLPLKGDLINRIHQMERRKLKTSKTYYVSQEGHENLAEIHQFLSVCRKHQDLNINVTLESLQSQVESFPNQYRIFSARKDAELMSAVIMNAATENIAYYFLPGTLPKFKKFSPMVGLIGHIYRDYQNEGFEYIDFGISSVDEVPQRSLITFKEHMGGIRNERITYFKQLTE